MPQETVKVKFVGPHGPMCVGPEGESWYSPSKKSGLTAESFEKGKEYTLDVFVSQKGNRYINSIVGNQTQTSTNVTPKRDPQPTSGPCKYGKPLSAYEIEQDKRIHASGIVQAVLQSPALVAISSDMDTLKDNVKEMSEFSKSLVASMVEGAK